MFLHSWSLLLYKIPPKPTSRRVYIWRKLKRLGAILLHDAVWVLPATPRTREQLQWLGGEIVELGGEAWLWEATLPLASQDDALVNQFVVKVEASYRVILSELKKKKIDLAALSRRYQQLQMEDYFQSELGQQVRAALISARKEVDS
jgi:hypothetical protein